MLRQTGGRASARPDCVMAAAAHSRYGSEWQCLKRQKSFYDDGDATKAKKQKAESEEESEDEEDEEEGEEESEDEEAESTEESDNQEGDEEEELEEKDGLVGGEESEFGSDATTVILGGEENERIVASEDDPANFVTMESAWEDGEKRIMKLT